MSRVLLVEPDRILAETYARYLFERGYEVERATTAEEALHKADRVDVIVLELQLIMHNGLELLYELRSYTDLTEVRVILLTVIPQSSLLQYDLQGQLGVNDYLYKPSTTLKKLLESIEGCNTRVA